LGVPVWILWRESWLSSRLEDSLNCAIYMLDIGVAWLAIVIAIALLDKEPVSKV